jgi:hypothetical protein
MGVGGAGGWYRRMSSLAAWGGAPALSAVEAREAVLFLRFDCGHSFPFVAWSLRHARKPCRGVARSVVRFLEPSRGPGWPRLRTYHSHARAHNTRTDAGPPFTLRTLARRVRSYMGHHASAICSMYICAAASASAVWVSIITIKIIFTVLCRGPGTVERRARAGCVCTARRHSRSRRARIERSSKGKGQYISIYISIYLFIYVYSTPAAPGRRPLCCPARRPGTPCGRALLPRLCLCALFCAAPPLALAARQASQENKKMSNGGLELD